MKRKVGENEPRKRDVVRESRIALIALKTMCKYWSSFVLIFVMVLDSQMDCEMLIECVCVCFGCKGVSKKSPVPGALMTQCIVEQFYYLLWASVFFFCNSTTLMSTYKLASRCCY